MILERALPAIAFPQWPKQWISMGFTLAGLSIAIMVAGSSLNTAVAGSITAYVLEGYSKPVSVVVDPLDDSTEGLAVANAIQKSLTDQGIANSTDGTIILEVEVKSAGPTGGMSSSERAKADNDAAGLRTDAVSRLSASSELDPTPPTGPKPRRQDGIADITLTLNLYKRGAPPIWTATAIAKRDFRSIEEQGVDLAIKTMGLFGRSGTIAVSDY